MGSRFSRLLSRVTNRNAEVELKDRAVRNMHEHHQRKRQKQLQKLQEKKEKRDKRKAKRRGKHTTTLRGSGSISRRSSTQSRSSVAKRKNQAVTSQDERNRQVDSKTEKQLKSNLCLFLVNQIVLTQQFLVNYESELQEIEVRCMEHEAELNQLLDDHSVFFGNPLDAAIAKWVTFKPAHGPLKQCTQGLDSQLMYVVFENIEVMRPDDANYDSITPLCKVELDTSYERHTPCQEEYIKMLTDIKWKGYVRLKLRQDSCIALPKACARKLDSIYTDNSSGYGSSTASAQHLVDNRAESECDYDYAYITHLNTHYPLSQLKMNSKRERKQLQAKVLPDSCISYLGQYIDQSMEDSDFDETDYEEDDDENADAADVNAKYNEGGGLDRRGQGRAKRLDEYKQLVEQQKAILQQRYLNSKEFMRYFGELMRHKLAPQLLLDPIEVEKATYRGASIYIEQNEIIPAIHVDHNAQTWPDCAFQFRIRDRPMVTSPVTGQKIQWPTRAMIKRIETFGFHVIPMGYAPKRSRNPFRELEWRIIFPKAERYLERHLMHTQMKVFILAKALVKTFVEPAGEQRTLMFAIDHLRMHLFWECERNYLAWPEEFLGDVLIRYLSTFVECLRRKCLKDYFIEERNLFECIPEYALMTLHTIFADIVANPLMHLMIALKNLNLDEKFFPKLNFSKMFHNLAEDDMLGLRMYSKNARNLFDPNDADGDDGEYEAKFSIRNASQGRLKQRPREKSVGRLRRKTKILQHELELKKEEEELDKFGSTETIDVEFCYENDLVDPPRPLRDINWGLENLRRTNALEMVLDHLLRSIEKSLALRTQYVAKVFLTQSRRLCKLYHDYGCDMSASEYLKSIQKFEDEMTSLQQSGEFALAPPELPVRASVDTVRARWPHTLRPVPPTHEGLAVSSSSDDEVDDRHANSEKPRKSIRFQQDTVQIQVQVHHTELESTQESEHHVTPKRISVVRFADEQSSSLGCSQVNDADDDTDQDMMRDDASGSDNDASGEDVVVIEVEEEPANGKQTSNSIFSGRLPTSIHNRLTPAVDVIKNSQLVNSALMKKVTTSTSHLVATLTDEDNQRKIREILKKTSLQIKGAFNQSSDT